MDHAVEGTLQAYLDGELDSPAVAELDRHLSACDVCTAELDALRTLNGRFDTAVALLDAEPNMLRARAAIAARRSGRAPELVGTGSPAGHAARLGGRSLAKAAMLLLALAGAGAAAIPGSPVRRALESTIARVAQWIGAGEEQPPVVTVPDAATPPAAPEAAEFNSARVWPTEGRIRVVLHRPAGAVDVVVRFTDAPQVSVDTEMVEGEVGFRSGGGRLEVTGLGAGRVQVELPRNMVSASVEVGGQILVYLQDDELRGNGPAAGTRGDTVSFRIGS